MSGQVLEIDDTRTAAPLRYAVFGGVIESDVPLPALRPAAGEPRWTVRTEHGEPTEPHGVALGDEEIADGERLTLYRQRAGGLRLVYSDTGVFDVAAGGATITWHPSASASHEHVQLDLLGRVMSTALHAAGVLALHASGVAIGGRAIGFIAPKFYGKSTTALALTYAGALLVTDDTLAVEAGEPTTCLPGVHSVRLRAESAKRFPRTESTEPDASSGRVVDELPEQRLLQGRAPLDALYLLSPVDDGPGVPAVRRERVSEQLAAMRVLSHSRMGGLFRSLEAVDDLSRAVHVARSVPVYTLHVARNLERIDEVARTLFEWHS